MRVESSGLAPGLANARPPEQHKICKCPLVARDGGGGGRLGAARIDWCIKKSNAISKNLSSIAERLYSVFSGGIS